MPSRAQKLELFFRLLKPYRFRLAGLVFLTVALSVLAMLPPLLMRAVIDLVLTQRRVSLFFGLGVCVLALPVVTALLRYLQGLGVAVLGQRFVFDLRVFLYERLLGLSLRFFGKHSVGKLVNRLMGDSTTVQHMLTAHSIGVISDLVCASFAVSAAFAINWRMAVLLLMIVALFVFNYRVNIVRIRRATRGYQSALDRVSGGVQNRLVASLAVKTFGMEDREHESFRGESETSLGLVQEALTAGAGFSLNTQLIQGVGYLVLYFIGCALTLRGDMSYGSVVAFGAYAMQLLWPAVGFSELAKQIQQVGIAMDRLLELSASTPEVADRPAAAALSRPAGGVVFDNVSFHYDAGVPILENFSLRVAPGETVALVGPTGCGKTTIISLLMRFYDVCGGSILIDGVDLRDIRLRALRRMFGVVLQEPLLFDVTIAENIAYSRPGAGMEDIEAAARVAEIHEFIASLPAGYDTRLGSEGVDLSVGQKQRLTIARAVLADPTVLVMDEATSALDSESERAIQKAIARALKDRTSFIVAHRLSTIRHADKILLLEKGRIIESGGHAQLMSMPDGKYRGLYLKHMGSGVITD